jgi:hypothetical protein
MGVLILDEVLTKIEIRRRGLVVLEYEADAITPERSSIAQPKRASEMDELIRLS